MSANAYETASLLSQYLLFHYGAGEDILPPCKAMDLRPALEFPARCVAELIDHSSVNANFRALDLGCAVGRSTFELCRKFGTVMGIDASHSFIDAANTLKLRGALPFARLDEGALSTACVAQVPVGIDRSRAVFEVGDAMDLPDRLPRFNVVLMANLLDRMQDPALCLARLPSLLEPGGQLIITSPYTWIEEFTPPERWLGGGEREGEAMTTFEALHRALGADFVLKSQRDLPFLIREHARKFQLGFADATVWVRR